jgi:hypothetical protein
MFLFLFYVFFVFVLFCVLFLLMNAVVSFLSVHKFTYCCHRVEMQLQVKNIISNMVTEKTWILLIICAGKNALLVHTMAGGTYSDQLATQTSLWPVSLS